MRLRHGPALALCAALAACTAQTPVIELSPTLPESPTPTSTEEPSGPPQARSAVYATGEEVVLYDARQDSVIVVARGTNLSQARFLTRNLISFVQTSSTTTSAILTTLDLRTNDQERVFEEPDGIDVYGWSPDRRRVAYITRDERGFPRLRIRSLVGTRATKSVVTLAQALGRGVSASDQLLIDYDRRGERFVVVFTYADGFGDVPPEQSQLQVRAADGSLLYAADHARDPTMATWSHNTRHLYFRLGASPRIWRASDGAVGSVAGAGEPWFNPSVSRDGRLLAYDTGQERRNARVRVLDLNAGSVRTVGERGRIRPVFATERFVWAQVLERCDGDECLSPTFPASRVVRININNGNERALAITSLADVDIWYA